jgi:EmrB/QacA subfamily drug resistance transporter
MRRQRLSEPQRSEDTRLDAALVKVALVVVLGSFMSILDSTIVSVALDTLGRTLRTSVSTIQWVTTGYLLSLAVVIPATSWIMAAIGAKRAWMFSIALFILGSTLCGVAWSPTSLILFRVLQGFGGGMILPIGQSILAREAGPKRMGRVMGIVTIPTLLGPILGPVLGGLILSHFSWRWIFFVNLPIGFAALILAARALHNTRSDQRPTFDLVGFLLVSPGLALLVLGLADAGSGGGLTSPQVLLPFAIGIVLVASFAVRSLRIEAPLLQLRLFANRQFRVASSCLFFASGSIFAMMFLLPLYYQVVRHQSPLHAAIFLAPQAVGSICLMPIAGIISDRAGSRTVSACGMAIMVFATYIFTRVGVNTNEGVLFGAQFVRGIGLGMSMIPLQAAAFRMLDRQLLPAATTLNQILQRVGSSLATALAAVILQSRVRATTHAVTLAQVSTHTSKATLDLVARAFALGYWPNLVFVFLAFVGTFFLSGRTAVVPETVLQPATATTRAS